MRWVGSSPGRRRGWDRRLRAGIAWKVVQARYRRPGIITLQMIGVLRLCIRSEDLLAAENGNIAVCLAISCRHQPIICTGNPPKSTRISPAGTQPQPNVPSRCSRTRRGPRPYAGTPP